MKNTFGQNISITIFGESHGAAIGAVLDGLPAGLKIDENYISKKLSLRRPSGKISTARVEADEFQIISGAFNGYTTGTALCILIPNKDCRSKDYEATRALARPGHADYTAYCKYHGFEDYRGGGHFSGRITAAIVAAGAIVQKALEDKRIYIGTHIKRCASIEDYTFSVAEADVKNEIKNLSTKTFAVIDDAAGYKMQDAIAAAAKEGDSVGGVLETAVVGLGAGLGEPWFDSIESVLSHILLSIPAIKGVEFGTGFAMADMKGSQANDAFRMNAGKIITETNNNGGINGGITNGMPVIFSCAVKPTPSIHKEQKTVDFIKSEDADITTEGRHDPAIIHRARVVVDSVTALAFADILTGRYGAEFLVTSGPNAF